MGQIDWASLIIGAGAITVGFKALRQAFNGSNNSIDRIESRVGKTYPCPGDGKMKCTIAPAGSIARRAKIIGTMIKEGSRNPEIRRAAVRAVSEKCDGDWCTEPRNFMAEITKVWGDLHDTDSDLARSLRQIEGVFATVKQNVRYVRDHADTDTFQAAHRTLKEFHGGDCDDHTIVLGSLLRSLGYPVGLRIYRTRGAPDWNHIALRVNADPRGTKWMTLDASVDRVGYNGRPIQVYPGWEAPSSIVAAHKDFIVK